MRTSTQTFKTLFLFFFSFLLINQAQATHALGGDLMYEQLSPTEFEVTLRLYRDCNGIAMDGYAEIFWTGSCGSGSDFAFRTSYSDITPICPTMQTSCQGGSGITGIEEHIYTAVITVPSGCSDLRFDYTLCCRNQVINTLIFPTSENIFLFAKHENVSNLMNSSPVFNNDPAPIVPVNKPVVYNHGVSDADGDSLYFSLSDCFEAYNDAVEYFPGFSGTNPLITADPVYIDSKTGALFFTPTVQQIGVMCVKVEEFRSGIKIGEVIRDIQFNVIAASNNPPVASGINKTSPSDSTNFVIDVCENGQVCFDLIFSDPNNDKLSITWNQEIPTGSFQVINNTTTSPEATFCWTPQSSDLGLNYFSVNVVDEACPIVGTSTYTYTVNVKSNTNTILVDYNNTVCVGDEIGLNLILSDTPDSVSWGSTGALTIVNDTFATVIASLNQSVEVVAYLPGSCNVEDSITIVASPSPVITGDVNTANLCANGTIELNGMGGATYSWSNGIQNGVAFAPAAGTSDFIVQGTDLNGCVGYDTVQFVSSSSFSVEVIPSQQVCIGEDVILEAYGATSYSWSNGVQNGVSFTPPAGITNYVVQAIDVNGCTSIDTVSVEVETPVVSITASNDTLCTGDSLSLTASGANTYNWDNGMVNGGLIVPPTGLNQYSVVGTTINGCKATASYSVLVADYPKLSIYASATEICEGDSITLIASGADTYNWNNGVVNVEAFTPAVGSITYQVTGENIFGCQAIKEIVINTNPAPALNVNVTDTNICIGDSTTLTATGANSLQWTNGVVNNVSFIPTEGLNTYEVTGFGANGCQATTSVDVMVHPLPEVYALVSDNKICEGIDVTLSGAGATNYTWTNGVVNGAAFQPEVGITNYTVTGIDANGCSNQAEAVLSIFPLPNVVAISTDSVICEGSQILLQATGAETYEWNIDIANGDTIIPSAGQYAYHVIGEDINGCVNTDTVFVEVFSAGVVQETVDQTVCNNTDITIAVEAENIESYNWNILIDGVAYDLTASSNYTGANSSELNIVELEYDSYVFYVELTDFCGNILEDTMNLNVQDVIVQDILKDTTLCAQDENELFFELVGDDIVWNDGTEGQFLYPTHSGTYSVTYADINTGCMVADSMKIAIEDCKEECVVVLPSGFSPNFDGVNDIFRTIVKCEEELSYYYLTIYDRWGNLVFASSDPSEGWDGSIQQINQSNLGVYAYQLSYSINSLDITEQVNGSVTLIQ